MRYPIESYRVTGRVFKEYLRRRVVLWAIHLGEDVVVPAGTSVVAMADGEVMYAEMRLGTEEKRDWGGIVITKHGTQNTKSKVFYSVSGHLNNLRVKMGDRVSMGQQIGEVAAGFTPENGFWKQAHLHFGIYTGEYSGGVLPGYWRPDRFWVTRVRDWRAPSEFIAKKGMLTA